MLSHIQYTFIHAHLHTHKHWQLSLALSHLKLLGHLSAGENFRRRHNPLEWKLQWAFEKNTLHCKALLLHYHGNGEGSMKCWESESQGYSIYSCFNNTTPLWKEYYIPCKYDENTYQIFPASIGVQWTYRTCHQGWGKEMNCTILGFIRQDKLMRPDFRLLHGDTIYGLAYLNGTKPAETTIMCSP